VKISLNWLKDYVALDAPVEDITHAITFLGFEVEQVEQTGAPKLDQVVVGEVRTREKHPNADKLSVCQVDLAAAGGVKTIVCGAQNYKVGDRVPVALPGAVLPGNFTIKQSKIRGHLSDGMMCSAKELGLSEDSDGLLILAGRPEIGLPINSVLPPGDTVFDLEITPNRPDCLSHLGIARELAAWYEKPICYPEVKLRWKRAGETGREEATRPSAVTAGEPGDDRARIISDIRVDAPEDCPLYTARAITGVKIGPSPAWMQERLRSAGLRPVNNVVDVGNFVMLEYGQPMHAFDARQLEGGRIIVRRAGDGEKIVTLDGKERVLNHRMLVIADASRPVVIAGIMGSGNSGVSDDTTEIVLECAIFKPASIRATSRRLGLSSDSSYRYERGVDPHMAGEAAFRALELILATAGGRAVGEPLVVGCDVPWRREIVVTTGFVNERLGFPIDPAEMKSALESLELHIVREEAAEGRGAAWTVSIPSWRSDLDRPIDLVEEILRLHGTDRIPPSPVMIPAVAGDDDPTVVFNRRATEYLVGHDFHECANLTLRSSREVSAWTSATAAQELALANPFVEDQSHIRPTLITGLLESLRLNHSRGVAATRLAETGRVFIESNGHNLECAAAAFVVAEDSARRWRARESFDFYEAKHHAAALASLAGIDMEREGISPTAGANDAWQSGHAAKAGDVARGWSARFGLLSLAMTRSMDIHTKVYAGIFAVLPERLSASQEKRRFVPFSLFPPALRDLALVVDSAEPAAEVKERLASIARKAASDAFAPGAPADRLFALDQIEIFDVYQGSELPEGRKNLAFSLVFRSTSRTLTDDEVNAVFQKIQDELARTTRYSVRK
jgi:phenylalanyl-tRNA synthetase beta chain